MKNHFSETIQFIRTIYQQPEGFIPLHVPKFWGNEKKYLMECIDTTFVSSVGKFVNRFEEKIAEYTGVKKAIVCVNGTNALHMALLLSGVRAEDEVITQPLTFVATANAIAYCNAISIFLDVSLNTLGLCPIALETFLATHGEIRGHECYNKITGRRIKACVPMHTFGHPCEIDRILDICNQYHIDLVEDAAESMGSYYKGKHTGTFGKLGILSFNGNKIITTGGGGMILTNDEELGKKAKHLTTQAKVPHPWVFSHDHIGYNYRMPNINAAIGLAQLEKLDYFIERKRWLAEQYHSFFKSIDINFFTESSDSMANYWLNVILLKDRDERDKFLKYSNEMGVMTRPAWRLMNKLGIFLSYVPSELKNAEHLEDRIVNIPSSVIL